MRSILKFARVLHGLHRIRVDAPSESRNIQTDQQRPGILGSRLRGRPRILCERLRNLVCTWRGILLTTGSRRCLLNRDVDRIVSFIAKVLDFMLDGREPAGFTGLGVNFRDLASLVSELEMSRRQIDDHAAGMVVQVRLLVRAIVDVDHLIGRRNLSWSGSSLPPGLQVTSIFVDISPQCILTDWVIEGTPTTAGTFTFSVTATESSYSGTATYTITIAPSQASAVPSGKSRAEGKTGFAGEKNANQ